MWKNFQKPNIIKMNKITKISTIYRKEREANPEKFQEQRNSFLDVIVRSRPKMNVSVIITKKSF